MKCGYEWELERTWVICRWFVVRCGRLFSQCTRARVRTHERDSLVRCMAGREKLCVCVCYFFFRIFFLIRMVSRVYPSMYIFSHVIFGFLCIEPIGLFLVSSLHSSPLFNFQVIFDSIYLLFHVCRRPFRSCCDCRIFFFFLLWIIFQLNRVHVYCVREWCSMTTYVYWLEFEAHMYIVRLCAIIHSKIACIIFPYI